MPRLVWPLLTPAGRSGKTAVILFFHRMAADIFNERPRRARLAPCHHALGGQVIRPQISRRCLVFMKNWRPKKPYRFRFLPDRRPRESA